MEKTIPRTCLKCNVERRTTVHLNEQKDYYCEICLTEAGRELLTATGGKKVSSWKGFVIIVIVAVIAYLIGRVS